MTNALKPRHASVQFADPTAPSGMEVTRDEFLKQCKDSAVARFRGREGSGPGCRTIEHPVPTLPGNSGSTGTIMAHVSPAVYRAWQATAPGTAAEKRSHVDDELQLALTDLADQDMHGYLALTEAQCDLFRPDLIQLVNEALDRTTFSHLGRRPDPRWEGTLVERLRPPYLILIVSIDFERQPRRKRGTPPVVAAPHKARLDYEDGNAGA
ncbi:MAG: hypothetical protein WC876_06870 [Candidatus Thermoplasmatota archaeon]|jgi:hypothetical protein